MTASGSGSATVAALDSIAALRCRAAAGTSCVNVCGYYAPGDGGGGLYVLDTCDTATADNGGTVIVAVDGGRWKLARTGALSVRQFGAKGDRTTDDRAAIQAAIDCFDYHGGAVRFPAGEYAIGGAGLVLSDRVAGFNGCVLEGEGQGVVLLKIGPPNSLLSILGKRATVRGLTFDGDHIGGCGIFCDTAFDGQPTLIENCAFVSFTEQGIFNNDGDAYMVRNCYFLGCGQYAIASCNNLMNSTIAGNFMQGSGGVYVNSLTRQAEGLRITDNTILCVGGAGVGVMVERGLEIIIANNVIDQTTRTGVRVRGNASYVKVLGNWIAGGYEGCVWLEGHASRVTVSDNTFEGGTTSQLVANSQTRGDVDGLIVKSNQFGNIPNGFFGVVVLNTKHAIVADNVTHVSPGGSLYWNTSSGLNAPNCFHKAPITDGSGSWGRNVIG